MKTILKHITDFFFSLRTTLWLIAFILVLMLTGAVVMPGRQEFQELHSVPMFEWLVKQPLDITWWLWGLIAVLAVLTVNTIFCSIESVWKKRKVTQWLLLISPQIIHIGFLFILLAHLLSAQGNFQEIVAAQEGSVLMIADKLTVSVRDIDFKIDYYGYVKDWTVVIDYLAGSKVIASDKIKPNDPSTLMGFNVNVKDIQVYPQQAVLLQINSEPGAIWALTGGILFMIGIVTLVALKIRLER